MKTKVSAAPDARRVRLEQQVTVLAECCPIDRSNPISCPLFGVRELSVRQRKAWVRRLTRDDLEYLATYHVCCAGEKKRAIAGMRKVPARPRKVKR